MNEPEIVQLLVKRDERIAYLEGENKRFKILLDEAGLQINYLHDKFQETGSGNNILSKIKAALND